MRWAVRAVHRRTTEWSAAQRLHLRGPGRAKHDSPCYIRGDGKRSSLETCLAREAGKYRFAAAVAAILGCCVLPGAVGASEERASPWTFQAALYVYLPTLSGSTAFPPEDGSSGISLDTSTLLSHLKMTFMGSFQAQRGAWGAFTDLIYIDLGDAKTVSQGFSIGGMALPSTVTAHTDFDLRGWLWTLAATYRPISSPQYSFDVLFGMRLLDIQQRLTWQLEGNIGAYAPPDQAGRRDAGVTNWDAIAGVKGRVSFGPENRYFALYYLDAGAGNSRFTSQLMAGAGYAFRWGELLAAWRYIDYQMKSSEQIQRLSFTGPLVAVQFRW